MEKKMIKKILPILLALSVLLTACGAQGTPTMSPADVEGTAVSAAWTMVAATQNAIPTITPLPPTEIPSPTPLPTFTPLALPTLPLVLPTSTTAASAGNCLGPIDFGEAGKLKRVRIENESGGTLSPLSLNLWTPNAFGQCGAMSLNMNIGGKEVVELPVGSWYAYAWINLKNGKQSTSEGSFILPQGGDDLVILHVKEFRIDLKGP
jgi:hypothetical protein